MEHLIIMRHAKAERRADSGRDFDRPLSERGRADAQLMGQVLAKAGYRPGVAVVSPARRTQETWAAVRDAFPDARPSDDHPNNDRSTGDQGLYNASVNLLRQAIDDVADGAASVLLIAHNPGVHDLTVALLREGGASPGDIAQAQAKFPTATAAVFRFDTAGRPQYDGCYYVADYGGGGGE